MNIQNKKARFNYEIVETYTAGILLVGTEIKSVREGKANFTDSYCYFKDGDLYVKNLNISPYSLGTCNNHDPLRDKKIMMWKRELRHLQELLHEKGYTIVPMKLFVNEKGWAKIEIGAARGKKQADKKQSIKERDIDIDTQKQIKDFYTGDKERYQ